MSPAKPSTMGADLQQVFGDPVPELHDAAVAHDASPARTRALELRAFLALTEEQVARVRDRVHEPRPGHGRAVGRQLRFDAQWLEAALDGRDGYRAALGELLRTMPSATQQPRPVRMTQPAATATLV
ncbi:hypothetical protein, partial [Streptomyces sp. NPDC056785]|uniref:hypothetical protein n=1 Tax=Streptomyces sp. NPDC056785 TaxID=3345944 RepID=UPI003678298C